MNKMSYLANKCASSLKKYFISNQNAAKIQKKFLISQMILSVEAQKTHSGHPMFKLKCFVFKSQD